MPEMGELQKDLRRDVYAVAGSGDALASAARAAAGPGELCAVAKDKSTVLASGRFEHESPMAIARDSFHDVQKMVFDLSLRNTEELRQLIG
jgi:hypothetical protein